VNIELLERAAVALGDLVDSVMFVGGATIELWLTDPGAIDVRPTLDVDVVVEVTSRLAFQDFEAELRRRGFAEDLASGVICRWQHNAHDLTLDAMPARAEILGFENRWQAAALPHAVRRELPSRVTIRAAPPPYLLAMKLEAFRGRGRGDFIASRDFEDIVTLLDRRPELVAELRSSEPELRRYVAQESHRLIGESRFVDGITAALPPDDASQRRASEVVRPAFDALADLPPDA
jgi:hypothetical protein